VSQVRILVLTSSTGGGHDARAQAFAEWAFELYRHKVDVRIEQLLEKSSVIGRWGVQFYNWIQKRAPWLHHPYYLLVEGLSIINRDSVSFGKKYYRQLLREYRPHLIFSVHDCLNRGYFEVARHELGADNVRCTTYCGEFSGGYGYSRNWVDRTVDLYFSRTPTARDYALKLGLPAERAKVRGHLMRPRSHHDVFDAAKKRRFLEEKLGLRSDRFTVLLGTGGNGANNHMELLPVLAEFADRVQAIVVCGHNARTYAEAVHWRAQHPEFPCFIDGYTDEMHRLLQVSDAIVTRGGTTTCAKALHFRCPIVFNAFGSIMPQERLTVKYFDRGGGCAIIDSAAGLREVMEKWIRQPGAYEGVRRSFEALRYEEDPTVLIHELIGLGFDAAQLDRPVKV
jgi:processive 1,2-diacylglycerol beta-glucosyltransferase